MKVWDGCIPILYKLALSIQESVALLTAHPVTYLCTCFVGDSRSKSVRWTTYYTKLIVVSLDSNNFLFVAAAAAETRGDINVTNY